jgi:hypothetical protein
VSLGCLATVKYLDGDGDSQMLPRLMAHMGL